MSFRNTEWMLPSGKILFKGKGGAKKGGRTPTQHKKPHPKKKPPKQKPHTKKENPEDGGNTKKSYL